MPTPCDFKPDLDSAQGTSVLRCDYCGLYAGNGCLKEPTQRSMVMAYLHGNAAPRWEEECRKLIAEGVKPWRLLGTKVGG